MPKTIVIMPAYNAAKTLRRTYEDIPKDIVSEIILGDDCSHDNTIEIARSLGIKVLKTPLNLGYGGNQKMLYDAALKEGADIIVMIHPDWQYDATKIPQLIAPIIKGEKDVMLGSRILGGKRGTLAGGMPIYKFISNRFLTLCENLTLGLKLSEYHTGMRAYSRKVLETVPYQKNSDNFVFDTEFLAEAAANKFRVGEIAIPCRYFSEASSVNFVNSTIYGLQTLSVCWHYLVDKARYKN
ncbi:glycosyl transferase family 2 [candidate division WOR-1 bacterium RIFOXYA12_FULL_43_27]|uniref:Glycosyl transferase family 2 n=1 Tax=candidate division WOR-1 bacterium RIFOXYC2_FULL_46_14 TaxID=1802587 RepID=A0A1F4U7F7_UNCSA|nr:MAG: glycosyl transferase family 2 [candidate division WOR-1 bacterium RIFOXYA12_FULL_43_27]OGC19298.1 MAG: glycosyl transferase family 2 [candidate division WOR-1 bacterium RIFOXYB2_FULL_46_45]OGC30287.1 MAG: glycosyl transferase family 2 [candidate division WOR-1 bacterium RIFOXYA2_FULL_46_56]OGC40888.1 MAG: glycosyl transferase family 2 [candidate division WOR-1 bacterium RIFOXYC2_FULL_46_14]